VHLSTRVRPAAWTSCRGCLEAWRTQCCATSRIARPGPSSLRTYLDSHTGPPWGMPPPAGRRPPQLAAMAAPWPGPARTARILAKYSAILGRRGRTVGPLEDAVRATSSTFGRRLRHEDLPLLRELAYQEAVIEATRRWRGPRPAVTEDGRPLEDQTRLPDDPRRSRPPPRRDRLGQVDPADRDRRLPRMVRRLTAPSQGLPRGRTRRRCRRVRHRPRRRRPAFHFDVAGSFTAPWKAVWRCPSTLNTGMGTIRRSSTTSRSLARLAVWPVRDVQR